jgi:hypothetical protein
MMNIKEVVDFIDQTISAKTGKHLNDLQRKVIEGVLNHQKYVDIADSNGKSEGHVKDVGYELLQLLSDIFDEPVKKGNLQSVLERQGNFNLSLGDRSINSQIIGCVNFGDDESKSNSTRSQVKPTRRKRNKRISKIKKLKQKGLSNQEIADILEIDLELVKNIEIAELSE